MLRSPASPAPSSATEQLVDLADELGVVELALDDVAVGARLQPRGPVLRATERGDEQDRQGAPAGVGPDATGELETTDLGHRDVGDDDVERRGLERGEGV